MSLEENAKMMADFGLTYNEAKVYIALVHLGLASVGETSKVSKVRREEVYRILPKLEKIGLIERVLGTPVRVRSIPLEDALSILVNREKEKANKKILSLTSKTEEFLKNFKANGKKIVLEKEEEAQFVLISEKDAIISRCTSLINKAQKEIDLVSSRIKLIQFIYVHAELLKKAIRRGINVRIITEMPEDEDLIPIAIEKHISPGISLGLNYMDNLPSHYIIFDNREAMMSTSTEGPLAESPSLWTNNSNLLGLMQKNFEDLWHASVDWANVKSISDSERAIRSISRLGPTDHAIFVYGSLESKHDVLFRYIKSALENGEAAVYVCSEEDPGQIKDAIKRFGVKVEEYEKAGALSILYYTDFYIIEGKFSVSNTIGLLNKLYEEALAKGFKGLRVTGEMACFFIHGWVQELVEYEKALHRVFDTPIVAICAYNANILTENSNAINLYTELVKTHGTVLFTGTDNKLGRIELRKA